MDKFSGILTALVTPFLKGEVDFESLKALVRYQCDQGVDGFVVNGTTAESPCLEEAEVKKIFELVKEESGGRPILLGTGLNSTKKTIQFSKTVCSWGAGALLVVVPYYNKPTQKGLVEHYLNISRDLSVPIMLYNVPGRTVTSMSLETITKLSQDKNIFGIKEASGDISFGSDLLAKVDRKFLVTSGDDASFLNLTKSGGRGVISVLSNLFVRDLKDLFLRTQRGDITAIADYEKYQALLKYLYIESNPIPVKWALYKMGIIRSPEMRLPMTTLSEEFQETFASVLRERGLIS